jgi:Bacterial protein of unknown function (DUF885)
MSQPSPSIHRRAFVVLLLAAGSAVAQPAPPAWVAKSDQNTQLLLEIQARFSPESAGNLGIAGLDEEIFDLSPGFETRSDEASRQVRTQLGQRLASESDPRVRLDLQILIDAIDADLHGAELGRRLNLPYVNLTQTVFGGLSSLLDDQVEAARRPAALVRLKKYAGLTPGTTPIARLAEDYTRSHLTVAGLTGPFKDQVERDLRNNATLVAGLAELFQKYDIQGYEQPLAKLTEQLAAYDDFVRREILPRARTDFRLPPELYANSLQAYGVDMPVDELISRAEVAFREIQNEMEALAPRVAQEKGLAVTDYRSVLRELKKQQLSGDAILPHFQARIKAIEEIIRREGIVSLPDRPMKFRVASEAESVSQPAPHFQPPRLIGNTGEMGVFILPLRIPGSQGSDLTLDDFTYDAFSWPVTAHEGRPGHDLQFASLIENGVSKARSIFAANGVNIEGWALYAEAEVKPYLPLDGQLAALQSRLARAARALLDPCLQRGTITREEATRVLRDDVGVSEGLALQEVQRYTFRAPGQATTYFVGYLRLMELRAEAERKLGKKFDRRAFHDFLLAQGLLPPKLLRQAVFEEFLPHQK